MATGLEEAFTCKLPAEASYLPNVAASEKYAYELPPSHPRVGSIGASGIRDTFPALLLSNRSQYPPQRETGATESAIRPPASSRTQESSTWASEQAFRDTLQRARDEGVNIFAAAPLPSYRQSASRQGGTPKLEAPHIPSTGVVMEDCDMHRLDSCLTRDYFQRPAWNMSTLPRRLPEDTRSLETIARERRAEAMSSLMLRHEDTQLQTNMSLCQSLQPLTRGGTPRSRRSSLGAERAAARLRPATVQGSRSTSARGSYYRPSSSRATAAGTHLYPVMRPPR